MDTLSDADRYYMLDTIILGSCRHLRNVFKIYWKQQTKEEWVNNDDQKEKLLLSLPLSKTIKCLLPSTQQTFIKEKSLGSWDMTLIAAILSLLFKSNDEICKAIKNLKTLRNSFAHVGTGKSSPGNEGATCFRKCTAEEFEKSVKEIKESLLTLGMEAGELNKMLEKPGETLSFKALKRVQNLYAEAEELIKLKDIDQAIELCSDAIGTPNLLPEHLGEAYEKRAEFYLIQLGNQLIDDDLKNRFQLDIQRALEINSSSWKACYLAGQYHQLENNYTLAISYYKTALALSPGHKDAKHNMELCMWFDSLQKIHDHFNHLPMNEQERVNDWIEKTGIHMTEEEYIKSQRELAGKRIPGQDYVFIGHQYRFGWWKEGKDFEQAAKHYAKADEIGNPEGSYNLAYCYLEGNGVERDIEKALAIFGRVAQIDEDTVGTYTYLGNNIGVAAAKYTIGLFYDNGIFFEKDSAEAAIWYRKAMDTGIGHAANNLARLYASGTGVPQDDKMAEMCWKQGVNLRELNSAAALVECYLIQLEPELALKWLKIGREMGNYWLLQRSDTEFDMELQEIKAQRDQMVPEVIFLEIRYGLDTKGLLFGQRLARLQDFQINRFVRFPRNVIEKKKYLQSPVRKEHILTHRQHLRNFQSRLDKDIFVVGETHQPKYRQPVPNLLSEVKRIYLNEMNPTVDNIFEDEIIYLIIIDDPLPSVFSIHLIAEDDNGDTIRLYIYNVGRDKETLDKVQAGCRIFIRNPYMRIGAASINHGIRNDEPACITHLQKIEKMCRFCGEGNAQRKCSICKRPYCSRECQKLDWKMFQHKLICSRKIY